MRGGFADLQEIADLICGYHRQEYKGIHWVKKYVEHLHFLRAVRICGYILDIHYMTLRICNFSPYNPADLYFPAIYPCGSDRLDLAQCATWQDNTSNTILDCFYMII